MKKARKLVIALAVAAIAVTAASTAHAYDYYTTCISNGNGSVKVRGYVYCDQSAALVRGMARHLGYAEAGGIHRYTMYSVGRVWTCYLQPHHYSTVVDCYAGHPVNSQIHVYSTVGTDTRVAYPPLHACRAGCVIPATPVAPGTGAP
jgi:hypothetical protein